MTERPCRNVELKARLHDWSGAARTAAGLATGHPTVEQQTDTYFHSAHGRLKLREIEGQPACLVAYQRPDAATERTSSYHLVPVDAPADLRAALATALGVRRVVHKERHIYHWKNVRIHLDRVADLGTFLEFEAVLGVDVDELQGREQVAYLRTQFGVRDEDVIAGSYLELA